MNLGFLTQKEGPLPVWGWVAIGAAAYLFLFRKPSQAGSQGVQYVLSYVPQTDAGGASGSSGGTTTPPPITGTPVPGPPVTTPPAPTPGILTPQQIFAYLHWANPNGSPTEPQGFGGPVSLDYLNNLSPAQLAEQSNFITSSPYYQSFLSGAPISQVAPWLSAVTAPPDNSGLTASQIPPPAVANPIQYTQNPLAGGR